MADLFKLREVLRRVQNPLFAVVDGAQFPDLPSALFDEDLYHRSLYRDAANAGQDQERAAPQLVWLDRERGAASDKPDGPADQAVLERLIDLVNGKHACVFWECDGGGERLYRHLRTINMALFPTEADVDPGKSYEADPRPPAERPAPKPGQLRRVILRHADANVMAQLIPSLNQAQYLRLLGPANAIIFQPDEEWGANVTRASRKDNAPPPPRGPLTIDLSNIEEIENRRREAVIRKRMIYLRKVAPDYTVAMSDDELRDLVRRQEAEANELGLKREYSHKLWAFMMVIGGEKAGQAPEVRAFIKSGPGSPDQNFDVLFNKTKSVVRIHRNAA
ncbi:MULTISPECIES: DUF4123 domain-containing protein [unclassified Mesorhizobium]|uniref:DUF4123 domain-containing protein n=1 Tax=unclassified Mesorhizobium TaxID=325217 RepID=UPI0030150418